MKDFSLTQEDIEKLANLFSGKLLLREEINLNSTLFRNLLQQNYFIEKPSIIQSNFSLRCNRCGNKKPHLFGEYPCLICEVDHLYCRNCIQMGRISTCKPLYQWSGPSYSFPKHTKPCSWEGTLTPLQQKAADKIVSSIINKKKEFMVWAVCGAGKTEMLFPGITKALELGLRLCIASPRTDVVRELYPRLSAAFPKITIQALYSGSPNRSGTAQLIISTAHQLLRYRKAFEVVIIDEVDAFPYHVDPSLPFATKRALKSNGTMIYLTATPRDEQKRKIHLRKLPHTFVPLRYHNYPLPIPTFKFILNLQRQLKAPKGPSFFYQWLKKRSHPERQILVFVPTISLADKLAQKITPILSERKIVVSSVHAEDDDRTEKIQRFRKGEIFLLITTTILERGVTFPSVDVLVFDAAHSVFDEAALVQIAGRAGRSASDPTGEVIFFHDGKTKAMVQAKKSIKAMNKRAMFYEG